MPSALATGHPVSLHLSTFTPTAPCGAVSASVAQFPPRGPESTPEGRFHRKLKHSGGVWQSNDGLRRAAVLTAYYPRLLTNGDAGRHRRRSGQFRINGALRRRLRVVRPSLPQGRENVPGGRIRPELGHATHACGLATTAYAKHNSRWGRPNGISPTARPVGHPAPQGPDGRYTAAWTADTTTSASPSNRTSEPLRR